MLATVVWCWRPLDTLVSFTECFKGLLIFLEQHLKDWTCPKEAITMGAIQAAYEFVKEII
jgi:hypothetical protein